MTSTSSEKSPGRSRKEKLLQDSSSPASSPQSSEYNEQPSSEPKAKSASSLSLLVFFVLLVMVSIGLWFLFVNWPSTSDEPDAKIPMTEAILRQATRWYEAEVVGDDHGHEESSTVGGAHGDHGSHHEDEGEKFYWEEEWPEPKEEEDEHEHDDHGSGDDHHHSGDKDDQSTHESKTSSEEVSTDHTRNKREVKPTEVKGEHDDDTPGEKSKPEQSDAASQDNQRENVRESNGKEGFKFEADQSRD